MSVSDYLTLQGDCSRQTALQHKKMISDQASACAHWEDRTKAEEEDEEEEKEEEEMSFKINSRGCTSDGVYTLYYMLVR